MRARAPGAPAWKAEAGKRAQEVARTAGVHQGRHSAKTVQSAEQFQQLAAEEAEEREPIGSPYAQQLAKGVVNRLYETAGGLAAAQKVIEKMAVMPEIRVLVSLGENPELELNERCLDNVVTFLKNHLSTKGTRHAEDQNVHDAILTALVDEKMVEDKLINAVAKLVGARWEAIKRAVLRRAKLNDEETEKTHGNWTRVPRSKRCDEYELPGLYAMCHDDEIFRFCSRRSTPLREHVGLREYKVHWPREVPNEMKDVQQIYLHDPRAEKYRKVDRDKNNGNLPERTTILDNICFCLIKPTFDQCADPTYTQLRVNLPLWNKSRAKWHESSNCGTSCACSKSWFHSFTDSEPELNKAMHCMPVACPELQVNPSPNPPTLTRALTLTPTPARTLTPTPTLTPTLTLTPTPTPTLGLALALTLTLTLTRREQS